jgi:hypothetical protein
MRALKILVVVMGVALLAGLAVVVVTIIHRASRLGTSVATTVEPARAFGSATVRLPQGASVLEMRGVGSRLVLRLLRADGGQALLVLDPDTGNALGTIELRAGE